MTKIKYQFSLLMAAVICLVSCSKENHNNPGPVPEAPLKVKKISNTNTNYEEFGYNEAGLLSSWASQWENGNGSFNRINTVLEYENGKLVKMSNEAGTITYSYTGNKITGGESVSRNNVKISALTFGYNTQGQLEYVLEKPYHVQSGTPIETKTTYSYYPDGNLKQTDFLYRTVFSNNFVVDFSKKYVLYDTKINPIPSFVIGFYMPGVVLYKNNPLRIENYDENGSPDGYSRFEYTYNAAGYPATKKHYIAVPSKPEEFPASYVYNY